MKEEFEKFKLDMLAQGFYDEESGVDEMVLYQKFLEKKQAEEEELKKQKKLQKEMEKKAK